MKRAACIVGMALELALVAGAVALNHFARAKLGMNRWLVYHNHKWEEALPIGALQVVAACALIALLAWALVAFARSAPKKAALGVSIAASAVLVGSYVWFCVSFSPATARAYYLMAACLFAAALLQVLQSAILSRHVHRVS